jgi:hypothetical protein
VATAELFPKFHLPGTIGPESLSGGDLLEWVEMVKGKKGDTDKKLRTYP